MTEPDRTGKTGKAHLTESAAGRFLIKLAAAALLLGLFFTFVMGIHIQHGNRMYPFIMDGDVALLWKLEPYHEGDVAAYRDPDTGETVLSRIIAAGEHRIEISENGVLTVDGVIPAEKVFYPTAPQPESRVSWPYETHRQEVFVLNDFRSEGHDSRVFGALSESELLGKVIYIFRRRGI